MDNLIFCLNATIPIFLLMVLGWLFKKYNIFSENFVSTANSFVFKIALPVLVFEDLAVEDFRHTWDSKYVIFCFAATLISIVIAIVISFIFSDKASRGEFAQASYRSSAALLGIGFIQNIYGTSGMAPLMIIGTVPLYNVMAVVILSFLKPGQASLDKDNVKKTLLGILKNPIIIGIALGLLWSVLKLPHPAIMAKTLGYLGSLSTPLGIMAMGAGFKIAGSRKHLTGALFVSLLKLIIWCAIFLPLAIHSGFYNDKLIAILVMLGSPSTISCYIMAKNMGHEGTLTTMSVLLTSLLSAFTLTMWLYILRSMGYI